MRVGFGFTRLVEKVARVQFLTNHRVENQNQSKRELLSTHNGKPQGKQIYRRASQKPVQQRNQSLK